MDWNNPEDVKAYKHAYYEKNKERLNNVSKQWRDANIEYCRVRNRSINKRVRMEVIAHYGGKCWCCGEDRYEFLALDHIEGNGNKHRRQINATGGVNMAFWLRRNGYPEGYRVLCHNCNMALGMHGYCPHKAEVEQGSV